MGITNNINASAAVWTLLALLAASIEPIIVKIGYRGNITPHHLLVVKTLVAAILILPITRKFQWIGIQGIKRVGSVSVLLLFNNFFTLLALKYVTVAVYLTMITTVPSLIAVVNSMRGRERITLKFWLGFIVCFIGVILSLDINGSSMGEIKLPGVVFVFLSMVCTIVYRIRMEKVTEEYQPVIVSLYIFWINAILVSIFFLPVAYPLPKHVWSIGGWIGFAAAVANVAFIAALHILGSTRISIFNLLQRPVVIILAALILKEAMTIWQIVGIVMVLVGINFAKTEKKG